MFPKIIGGFLNLTQKCNLKCKYCFVVQRPLEMDYKTAKDAVDFYAKNALEALKVPNINFFGGEPMLKYKEIVKPITEYIRKTYGDYDIGITTNGTLLTEESLKFFKDNNVGVLMSCDGNRESHNLMRPYHSGKGSYDDIDHKLFLKYFPNGAFRPTIDPRSVAYLFENYLWAEQMGYRQMTGIVNVFEDWTDDELKVLENELNKIVDYIVEKKKNNEFYVKYSEMDNMKEQANLIKDPNYYRSKKADIVGCGNCGIGCTGYGSVGATGDLYSCQEMTENKECKDFIIGNIYTGVDDKKRLEIASKFHHHKVKSSEDGRCEKCMLNQVCDGGCAINNYFKYKNLNVADRAYCFYKEQCLKGFLRIEEVK